MRKQSGFTLIELMVVMAIIAILATAGITWYGGYIKKAWDAKRLEDIRALETVAISTFDEAGQAISFTAFKAAVSAMNNGTALKDPLDNMDVCLTQGGDNEAKCGYQYYKCLDGGYVLRVAFESTSNKSFYTADKLNDWSLAHSNDTYDIWNCDQQIVDTIWVTQYIE